VRGNIISQVRTIATKVHTIGYSYDLADRVTQINYPSGRQVGYVRDGFVCRCRFTRSQAFARSERAGRITTVRTRRISTDAWANVASALV
jgi:hypothetical protein